MSLNCILLLSFFFSTFIGLNQLATFHGRSLSMGGFGFAHAALVPSSQGENLFSFCLQRLLEIMIFPSSCDYGLSSDRIDAFASTLINLIAMDVQRFNSCLRSLVMQQPISLQQPMTAILEKLVTSNGVDINRFDDRRNRLLFVQNMRLFVSEIRPLLVYR